MDWSRAQDYIFWGITSGVGLLLGVFAWILHKYDRRVELLEAQDIAFSKMLSEFVKTASILETRTDHNSRAMDGIDKQMAALELSDKQNGQTLATMASQSSTNGSDLKYVRERLDKIIDRLPSGGR